MGVAYVNRDFAAIARLCHCSLAAVCIPCRLNLGAGVCLFSSGVCLFDERIAKGWLFILFLRFISFKRYWWVFSGGVAKDKKHTYIHVHVELYMRILLLKLWFFMSILILSAKTLYCKLFELISYILKQISSHKNMMDKTTFLWKMYMFLHERHSEYR